MTGTDVLDPTFDEQLAIAEALADTLAEALALARRLPPRHRVLPAIGIVYALDALTTTVDRHRQALLVQTGR